MRSATLERAQFAYGRGVKMNHNVDEWLIVALYSDATHEFRADQHPFDHAYSGPEQRHLTQYRLVKDSPFGMQAADTKHEDIALAA